MVMDAQLQICQECDDWCGQQDKSVGFQIQFTVDRLMQNDSDLDELAAHDLVTAYLYQKSQEQ